ncbi:MAG TPA: hypothetical protein VGS41_15050 [Chthonomonadales bacterium]|nr:hypothetical protein [Chthonomonadales bacterium]
MLENRSRNGVVNAWVGTMYPSIEEIKEAIEEVVPGSSVEPIGEPRPETDWVIRSRLFKGMEIPDRRLRVRKIRDRLGIKGQFVGAFIPLAPGEKY